MPRNQTVTINARQWTELTGGDATAIRVQSLTGNTVKILATSGTTPPTDDGGAIELADQDVIGANYTLADLWPGVAGARRVWGWCQYRANVSVSHA